MGNCLRRTDVKYDDIEISPSYSYERLEIDNLLEQVNDKVVFEFKYKRLPSYPRVVILRNYQVGQ